MYNAEMKSIKCCKCGWVYFQVSKEYMLDEIKRFNEYFDTLTKEQQDKFYGGKKSDDKQYTKCWCGNNFKYFVDAKPEDVPYGSSIGPMLDRDADYQVTLRDL